MFRILSRAAWTVPSFESLSHSSVWNPIKDIIVPNWPYHLAVLFCVMLQGYICLGNRNNTLKSHIFVSVKWHHALYVPVRKRSCWSLLQFLLQAATSVKRSDIDLRLVFWVSYYLTGLGALYLFCYFAYNKSCFSFSYKIQLIAVVIGTNLHTFLFYSK